uniref:Uncharacterized protein n=1 Tax=Aegilops tauschii subsp. strangulata TaxID=200361 RepID=A0A453QNU2_AEGTS
MCLEVIYTDATKGPIRIPRFINEDGSRAEQLAGKPRLDGVSGGRIAYRRRLGGRSHFGGWGLEMWRQPLRRRLRASVQLEMGSNLKSN